MSTDPSADICVLSSATICVITNVTRGVVLADRAAIARTWGQRLVGLLARRDVEEGEGLVFPGCRSIHTCFMRFSIDVIFGSVAGAGHRPQATGYKLQAASHKLQAPSSRPQTEPFDLQPAACSLQRNSGQTRNRSEGAPMGIEKRGIEMTVTKVVERMAPFRVAWAPGAQMAIELPAGAVARTSTAAGHHLLITEDAH